MLEHSRTGAVDVVQTSDPINLPNVKPLSDVLERCLGSGQPRVVIDLEKVPLIDSAGLEMLLDYQDRCMECGGAIKLAAPQQLCRDILAVTGVLSRFEVHRDYLSAVGSFAQ